MVLKDIRTKSWFQEKIDLNSSEKAVVKCGVWGEVGSGRVRRLMSAIIHYSMTNSFQMQQPDIVPLFIQTIIFVYKLTTLELKTIDSAS